MAEKLLRDTLKIIHIALIFLISVFCGVTNAQQNLSGGDVLIISINTGSNSGFDFIPLVDLEKGTTIFFSNQQWHNKSKKFRGDGGTIKFTASFDISKGTTIHFDRESRANFVEESAFELSPNADNLIAFQKRKDENFAFLYGVAWGEAAKWKYEENLRSDIPPGLDVNKQTILSFKDSGNHQYFVRNGASGTQSMLRQFVGNPDFWNTDKQKFSPFGTSFTLLDPPVVLFEEPKKYIREDRSEIYVNVKVYEHDGSPLTANIKFQPESSTADSAIFLGDLTKKIDLEGLKGNGVREVIFEVKDDNKYNGRRIASFFLDSLSQGTYGDFRISNVIIEDDEPPNISLREIHIPANKQQQPNPEMLNAYPYLLFQNRENVAVDLSNWKIYISGYKNTIAENTILMPGESIYVVHTDSLLSSNRFDTDSQVEYIISKENIFDLPSGKIILENSDGDVILENEYVIQDKLKRNDIRITAEAVQSAGASLNTTNSNDINNNTSEARPNSAFSFPVPEIPGWFFVDRKIAGLIGNSASSVYIWDPSNASFIEKPFSNGSDAPAFALFLDREKINELKVKSNSNNLMENRNGALLFKIRADDIDQNGIIGYNEGLNLLSNSSPQKLPVYGLISTLKEKLLGDEANPEIYIWQNNRDAFKKLSEFEFIPPMSSFWLKLDVSVAPISVSLEVNQIINAPVPQINNTRNDVIGRLELEFRNGGDRFDRFMLKLIREEEAGRLTNLDPAGFPEIQLPAMNTHSFFGKQGAAPVSEMAISVLNEDKPVEIPLTFISEPGEKELIISIWDNIPPGYRFQFLDKSTGEVINLDDDWSFRFNHAGEKISATEELNLSDYTANFTERFSLRVLPPGYESNEDENEIPDELELYQNFPNPFNPVTTISFFLPESEYVKVSIFNVVGQPVATLVDGTLSQGEHRMEWDASAMPSGIYIYQLEAGSKVMTRKMTLVK